MKRYVEIPLHITGFWYSVDYEDPLYSGSLGAGINLKPYIKVSLFDEFTLSSLDGEFTYDTYRDSFRISGFKEVGLKIRGVNLLGLGFGLSAGYALAGLMLSNLAEEYGKTWYDIGRYVHIAEVLNGTGYGDVIALLTGGLEYRLAPGAPGIGLADKIPVEKDIKILVSITGNISTPEMLRRYGGKVMEVGPKIYSYFSREPSFERFIEASYKFSKDVGMLDDDLENLLKGLIGRYGSRGDVLGVHRKKNLLVIYCDESVVDEVFNVLDGVWKTFIYSMDACGIRVV